MAGPAGNPNAARDPHHHLLALIVGQRAWMIACYSAEGMAITRRREAAWNSRGVPAQIGFVTLDFASAVTWTNRTSPGHRTTLDIEDAHTRPLSDLHGLPPSAVMDVPGWRTVLNALEEYAKWDIGSRPTLTRFRQKDLNEIAVALRPPPSSNH